MYFEKKKRILQNNVAAKFIVPVHGTVRLLGVLKQKKKEFVSIKRIITETPT